MSAFKYSSCHPEIYSISNYIQEIEGHTINDERVVKTSEINNL